jgi:CBS domain containing-hemolysin-like protein
VSNPFAPPASDVRDVSLRPGSPIKGAIIGLLVDIGGTTITGIFIGIVFAVYMAKSGMSQEQIYAALSNSRFGTPISIVSTIVGGGFSMLGGYVCQRIALRKNYRLALLIACLSTAFGSAMAGSSNSLTWHTLMAALTFGSVLLGTKLAGRA